MFLSSSPKSPSRSDQPNGKNAVATENVSHSNQLKYKNAVVAEIESLQRRFPIINLIKFSLYKEKTKALIKVINILEKIYYYPDFEQTYNHEFLFLLRGSNLANDIQLIIGHQRELLESFPTFDVSKRSVSVKVIDRTDDSKANVSISAIESVENIPSSIGDGDGEWARLDIYRLYIALVYEGFLSSDDFGYLIMQIPINSDKDRQDRWMFGAMLTHIEKALPGQFGVPISPRMVNIKTVVSGALNPKYLNGLNGEKSSSPIFTDKDEVKRRRLWWGRLLVKIDIIIMDRTMRESERDNILKACSPLNSFMILLIQELIAYKPTLFQPEPLQPNQARGLFKTYNLFLYAYHLYLDGWQEFGVFKYDDFVGAIVDPRSRPVETCAVITKYYETIEKIVNNTNINVTKYMTTPVDVWYEGPTERLYKDLPPFMLLNIPFYNRAIVGDKKRRTVDQYMAESFDTSKEYEKRKETFFNLEKKIFKCLLYSFVFGDETSFMAIFQAWYNLATKAAIFQAQPEPGMNNEFYANFFNKSFSKEERQHFFNLFHSSYQKQFIETRKQRFSDENYFSSKFNNQFMFYPIYNRSIENGQIAGDASLIKKTSFQINQLSIEYTQDLLLQKQKEMLDAVTEGNIKKAAFFESNDTGSFYKRRAFLRYQYFAEFLSATRPQ